MNPFVILRLLREAGLSFWRNNAPRLGAALAFYTALSLSPLLLIVVSIAGAVFGDEAARGELAARMTDLVGADGANAIQAILAGTRNAGSGWLAGTIAIVTLVVGATGVFAELRDALNTLWGVKPEEVRGGVVGYLINRALSLGVVMVLAVLLLAALVAGAVLAAVNNWVGWWLPFANYGMWAAHIALSIAFTWLLFALIYKTLPHAHPPWRDVWAGALLAAVLFHVGNELIGLYLSRAAFTSAYGAAGSFVVLLVWVYYSTQILLFGAAYTQARAALRAQAAT